MQFFAGLASIENFIIQKNKFKKNFTENKDKNLLLLAFVEDFLHFSETNFINSKEIRDNRSASENLYQIFNCESVYRVIKYQL